MGKRINKYSVQLIKESARIYDLQTSVIRSPQDARDAFEEVFNVTSMASEEFLMLTLNTKNQIIGAHSIFKGTLNSSIVHPRDIFQQALLNNAASIIVCHPHPSGDTQPSPEDISVTKRLIECGKIIGIDVLDHIIIGGGDSNRYNYVSLKEKGHI